MRILDRAAMTSLLAACLLAAACGSKSGAAAAPLPDAAVDAGSLADAGGDAALPADTAQADAAHLDAAVSDAGPPDSIQPDSAGPDAADGADAAAPDTADGGATTKWYACAADADCGAIEIMCCDHCNGGKAVAANKQYGAEVKGALGAQACDAVACTEMACAPVQTTCHLGTCIIAGSQCAELGEAACKADTGCRADYGKPKAGFCAGQDPVKVFLGCSKSDVCGAAFGCATSPAGESYSVSQLCAPAGWKITSDCCPKECQATEPAVLCVRGKPLGDKEQLAVGDPVEVLVHPKGCFSSSCTKAVESSCAIAGSGGDFTVTANFCLANTANGGGCTADCGGGGFAGCKNGTWTAGTHAVSLGGVSVTVTVPGEVPAGGACAGSQF